ncbi:MAG: tryptophan synthase subunit alpha [Brachymonas sp.]|nr:tryptophan synthase subunit alpha [Brachymonas sp.]
MSRIASTFSRLQQEGRKALIPYLMAGFPQANSTVGLMHAAVDAGADVIELGVPFGDPMADGPVIQAAGERAIANGIDMAAVLAAVREFRQHDTQTPVVLMGYANSVESYDGQRSAQAFVRDASTAGVDGVLIVDYPPEESAEFSASLRAHGMDQIFLLAPTSTEARMQQVAQLASGFVYYVSLKGVTGSGAPDPQAVARALARIRQHIGIPVSVGFGIRDAASAQAVAQHADAVVIGSKLLQLMEEVPESAAPEAGQERVADFLRGIRAALDA